MSLKSILFGQITAEWEKMSGEVYEAGLFIQEMENEDKYWDLLFELNDETSFLVYVFNFLFECYGLSMGSFEQWINVFAQHLTFVHGPITSDQNFLAAAEKVKLQWFHWAHI